ncbi:MAG: Ig-like domain-containing protein, partial [Anaerolineales bacterium]
MNKKYVLLSLFLVFFSLYNVQAQSEDLTLSLTRNFGYSSGTGDIQGTFTMRVSGPDDLTRVVFYIDGEAIGEATEPPFALRFQTGNYPLGVHTLSAVGYTNQGIELRSNEQRREFVSAQEGMQFVGRILLPLLGIIILSVLLSIAIPALTGRNRKEQVPLGAPRSYGMFGGTICPKCGRPFGIHLWGINLAVGKLDRCPHCGKWSLVRRVPPATLRQAEEAEKERIE